MVLCLSHNRVQASSPDLGMLPIMSTCSLCKGAALMHGPFLTDAPLMPTFSVVVQELAEHPVMAATWQDGLY